MSSLRVRPELHRRAKAIAALSGKSLVDLAEEIFSPALDRLERDRSRFRSEREPTRT